MVWHRFGPSVRAPARAAMPPCVEDLEALLRSHFPSGQGPTTSTIHSSLRHSKSKSASLTLVLEYIKELERSLPAGTRPLVMRAYAASSDVTAQYRTVAVGSGVEGDEAFRLVLLGMRQYLEMYAYVGGRRGSARWA